MNSVAETIHNFKIVVSPWVLLAVVSLGILLTGQDWTSYGLAPIFVGLLNKVPAILTAMAAVFVSNPPKNDNTSPTVTAYN